MKNSTKKLKLATKRTRSEPKRFTETTVSEGMSVLPL